MATNPADALAPSAVQTPANEPFVFELANSNSTKISIDRSQINEETRNHLLDTAIRNYIVNSANQANLKASKANAAFDAYDEAMKADPLQTAVTKPEGARTDAPAAVVKAAADARERLYKGEVRKNGDGPKQRATKDPLTKAITDVVVREVFDKEHAANNKYKWPEAVKAVGGDGLAFLNARIDTLVAAGGNRAELEKYRDTKYVNPAKLMLGLTEVKATKDMTLL